MTAPESLDILLKVVQENERLRHDLPHLLDFHEKHALVSQQRPSCLVCGKVPEEWPPAIRHMELPNIIVCHSCRDAARQFYAQRAREEAGCATQGHHPDDDGECVMCGQPGIGE